MNYHLRDDQYQRLVAFHERASRLSDSEASKCITFGFMARALAIATRSFWPPESREGCTSALSANPTFASRSQANSRASAIYSEI